MARANQSNISSSITFLACWMKCWNGLRNYKIHKVSKKKKNIMVASVCSRTCHPTCFDAKVWVFHVGLVWWGVSSNIHKFLLISSVCTLELQFEFLNVCFQILNFVSITNIYCGWGRHKTVYYSSDEQDTPDMTGKAFKSHLK